MKQITNSRKYQLQIVWPLVIIFTLYHTLALHGIYFFLTQQVYWKTFIWTVSVGIISALGTAAGAHRLWSHRSFKAKLPLRVILALGQTIGFQNHIYEWTRDHRVHHQHTDTNADPHNSTRGFFFSHMGWLMVRKQPEVVKASKAIDLSDLEADPVVMFQKKYYLILAPLFCLVIPTIIPVICWGENFYISFCFAAVLRYLYSLHSTWLVNSAAHMWGMRPYNSSIKPAENWFANLMTLGEGWHNYHHTFPSDYRAAELDEFTGSFTTNFLDLMAKIGWAYDMKAAPKHVVELRKIKNEEKN